MIAVTSNHVFIRRAGKVIAPKGTGTGEVNENILAALLKNLESLGYILSGSLLNRLETYSLEELEEFYKSLVTDLKVLVGDHVRYRPMYPNFPRQVMEAPSLELYLNARMHYLGDWLGLRILPRYRKKPRAKLEDDVQLRTIELGEPEELFEILSSLLQAKVSFGTTEKEDLLWFIQEYPEELLSRLPAEIPNKENLATFTYLLLSSTGANREFLGAYFKTATDVLRLAAAMSEGDVSLSEPTKFTAFKRQDRRWLLELLDKCGNLAEDMRRRPETFKRLGERLHPFEYKKRYPKTAEAFDIIRNDKPLRTFHGEIESLIGKGEIKKAVELLQTRPGELARRLDHLLRIAPKPKVVLDAFEASAGNVSTSVLLQVMTHFQNRNNLPDTRVFFPKGNVARVQAIENKLPQIDEEVCSQTADVCRQALEKRFKELPALGNVYIDPELKNFAIPFGLRSASRALHTLGRGTRLPLPPGNTVRFFIWWRDGDSRTDIDLSALGLDSNSRHKLQITYYNLRELGGYHSGDITSAPDGASEFIDLDRKQMLENGVRYIVMSVNSYTEQPFYELPECFAGFMVRQHPNSGEIYEPRTVENRIDLTASTRIALPLIIDLKEGEVIWTDLAVTRRPSHNNNVWNNMSSLTLMNIAMTSLVAPNLFDLFELHAKARGKVTDAKEDANTIFATQEGITPLQTQRIVGEFL